MLICQLPRKDNSAIQDDESRPEASWWLDLLRISVSFEFFHGAHVFVQFQMGLLENKKKQEMTREQRRWTFDSFWLKLELGAICIWGYTFDNKLAMSMWLGIAGDHEMKPKCPTVTMGGQEMQSK